MGDPQNGWSIRENPIKMDDLEVPLFQETTIYIYIYTYHIYIYIYTYHIYMYMYIYIYIYIHSFNCYGP